MFFFESINSVYVFVGMVLLGATAGLIGSFAVLRRQGLLGDVLSHASLPGIVLGFLVVQAKVLPILLVGALVVSLLAAWALRFLTHRTILKSDAAMATVLSVFFGVGIVMLTYIQQFPYASQSGLDSFLFGQAAAFLQSDIIFVGVVSVVLILVVLLFWKELLLFSFDPEYAHVSGFQRKLLEMLFLLLFVVATVASLQAVGVVLTAALFITPAAAARLLTQRLIVMVLLSVGIGMFSGGAGVVISGSYAHVPTGPVVVLVASFVFFAAFFLAPRRGMVWRMISLYGSGLRVQYENVLGALIREYEQGGKKISFAEYRKRGYRLMPLFVLFVKGLVRMRHTMLLLTPKGLRYAAGVIEKHRLWETYLVHELKLAPDHVHRDAESMEHILNDEMVMKLRKILGNPALDPHGKPIKPRRV